MGRNHRLDLSPTAKKRIAEEATNPFELKATSRKYGIPVSTIRGWRVRLLGVGQDSPAPIECVETVVATPVEVMVESIVKPELESPLDVLNEALNQITLVSLRLEKEWGFLPTPSQTISYLIHKERSIP